MKAHLLRKASPLAAFAWVSRSLPVRARTMTKPDLSSETAKLLRLANTTPDAPRILATVLSLLLITPFLIGIALAISDRAITTVFGAVLTAAGTFALLALPAHFAFGYRAKWLLKVLIVAFVTVAGIAVFSALSR
jgi:hypothetical protein